MKEGKSKLKTLLIEDVKELKSSLLDYDGDVEVIALVPGKGYDLGDIMTALNNLHLFQVVAKPDPNLQDLGVNLDYHAVDPITVTDINLTDPDDIILNGDIHFPREGNNEVTIVGGYFADEELANELCREINVHTARRVDRIADVITKSQKFRRQIADNAMS